MLPALTFVLDAVAFHCTDLHGCHTSFGLSCAGDVLHLFSDFEERVQPAHVHDDVVLRSRLACATSPTRTLPRPEMSMHVTCLRLEHSLSNPAALSAIPQLSNSLPVPTPGQNVSSPPSFHHL